MDLALSHGQGSLKPTIPYHVDWSMLALGLLGVNQLQPPVQVDQAHEWEPVHFLHPFTRDTLARKRTSWKAAQ